MKLPTMIGLGWRDVAATAFAAIIIAAAFAQDTLRSSAQAQQSVLQVDPVSLSFEGPVGDADPDPQSLTITNAGSAMLEWEASTNAQWIVLGASKGALSQGRMITLQVFVRTDGLATGTHKGQITISASSIQGNPVVVVVSLKLTSLLEVSPTQLQFRGREAGTPPGAQTIALRNNGRQPLSWIAESDAKWLSLSSSLGELPARDFQVVTVSVQTANLTSGTHEAAIVVRAPRAQVDALRVKVVLLLDARSLVLRTLMGHTDLVLSVAFSPDGQYVASASWDGTIKLWEAATGKERRTFTGHGERVVAVAISPDGKLLASGSEDETVKLWELATGKEIRTLTGHLGPVNAVAFSSDGKLLASGSGDQTIKLWEGNSWEVALGNLVRTLQGHTSEVLSVVFSPSGKLLASGSSDMRVRLWDAATGRIIWISSWRRGRVSAVAFNHDGKLVASGSSDQQVRLWEVSTGELVRGLAGHTGWVNSVAFSPDGKLLASASDDQTIRLWQVATGEEARTLTGHTARIHAVAFSPDGKLLASASDDRTIKLWDVSELTGP